MIALNDERLQRQSDAENAGAAVAVAPHPNDTAALVRHLQSVTGAESSDEDDDETHDGSLQQDDWVPFEDRPLQLPVYAARTAERMAKRPRTPSFDEEEAERLESEDERKEKKARSRYVDLSASESDGNGDTD